jgi:hypothetical protein
MPFTEDQDMIQTVAAECPDQALDVGILPAAELYAAFISSWVGKVNAAVMFPAGHFF